MKKFQFHMEKLLSYKGQVLDSEMMHLNVLNNLLSGLREELKVFEDEKLRYKEEFESRISEQVTPADCRMYASYENHIKGQIEICEREIFEVMEQIEKQVERVKALKIEAKSLETIKESQFREYKKEDLKKQEMFVDEFISMNRVMNGGVGVNPLLTPAASDSGK